MIDSNDTELVKYTLGRMTGTLYVKDEKLEKNLNNRKIIVAHDFVDKYKVKSVIGFGGGYFMENLFFTTIIFLNKEITQAKARLISAELSFFKIITLDLVKTKIFND